MSKLSIGLIGAGAVGCFYAGHMAKKGADVTLITRSPKAYNAPIFIESIDGDFLFSPTAVQSIHDGASFDVVVLATKVLPSIDTVALIKPFMTDATRLMVIQNGIFIEDSYVRMFQQPIFRCLAFVCVSRQSRLHIQHMFFGGLSMGCLNAELDVGDPLVQLLTRLDVPVHIKSNIQLAIWEKLVWNVPFNSLSVICGGVTTKDLLDQTAIASRVYKIMKEVQLAAKAVDIQISDAFIDQKIEQTRGMPPYKTSMCLDYEAGRPMEYEAILGNLVRFAEDHQLLLPEIRALYQDVQCIQGAQRM